MRKFMILLLLGVCLWSPMASVFSEEKNDIGYYLPDDSIMLQCAVSDDSWYTNDPELLELMDTLEDYYIIQTERGDYISSGDVILMCNPFVFRVDQTENKKIVYCVARIDEYGMYQDKQLVKHIALGKTSFSCYKIIYIIRDGQQLVDSIWQPQKDEEFLPEYGCSTEGNNGITDEMIMIMEENDYPASTEEFANIYLQKNGITNCIVHIDM